MSSRLFHIVTLEFISSTQKKAKYGSKVVLEKRMEVWKNKEVSCHRLVSPPISNLPISIEIMLWLPYAILRIICLSKERKCNVILCGSHDFFNLWPGFIASKVTTKPYATIVHHLTGSELKSPSDGYKFRVSEGFKKHEALIFSLITIVNLRVLKKTTQIVAVSKSTKKQLSELGIKRCIVIYNGIEDPLLLKITICLEQKKGRLTMPSM